MEPWQDTAKETIIVECKKCGHRQEEYVGARVMSCDRCKYQELYKILPIKI